MSYIENDALSLQRKENLPKLVSCEKNDKLIITLAALIGIMGAAAAGITVQNLQAENIAQFAAAAVPGMAAWVISYLMYQNSNSEVDPDCLKSLALGNE